MREHMLKWRLAEVMARHQIKVGDLAKEMDVTAASVSNLRNPDMPRLTKDTLNKLLVSLNRLNKDGEFIAPADLFEFNLSEQEKCEGVGK